MELTKYTIQNHYFFSLSATMATTLWLKQTFFFPVLQFIVNQNLVCQKPQVRSNPQATTSIPIHPLVYRCCSDLHAVTIPHSVDIYNLACKKWPQEQSPSINGGRRCPKAKATYVCSTTDFGQTIFKLLAMALDNQSTLQPQS